MTHLSDEEKEALCPPTERCCKSAKQFWKLKRDYCLATCEKCAEKDLLKKIYWELRKQNMKGKTNG